MDDIQVILEEALKSELSITPRDYAVSDSEAGHSDDLAIDRQKMSVILIVPDFGDRAYVDSMANLLFTYMGFKEIAIHQEAYCAIFGAGLSSACVVDIGANTTSVTCVDEGMVNLDTRRVHFCSTDLKHSDRQCTARVRW